MGWLPLAITAYNKLGGSKWGLNNQSIYEKKPSKEKKGCKTAMKQSLYSSRKMVGKFTSPVRNVEYPILPVMSELSTVRCDRALGLWIAGTRVSNVDGELPGRSSGRAAAVVSTPGSRAQAATEGGFLGLRHKTKEVDGG